jgi:predicted transcriptional regulator
MEVENFVPENNKQDWFDELSSNQKQRIEQSLADLAAGKFVSHDEVRRKVKLLFEKFEK